MFWRSPGFVQASPVEVRVVLPVFQTCTRARVPPCTLRHRASHLRHSLTTLSPPNPRRLGPQLVLDKESFTLEELLEEVRARERAEWQARVDAPWRERQQRERERASREPEPAVVLKEAPRNAFPALGAAEVRHKVRRRRSMPKMPKDSKRRDRRNDCY